MIRYKSSKYTPSDSMSDLICENYPMLLLISRFGIDLGFGDDTIEEVCEKSEVDLTTFLAVVNLMVFGEKAISKIDFKQISLSSMILYLHNSHAYFLEYRLPSIRRNLVAALNGSDEAVSIVIVNYFDEYFKEVTNHMMYEENRLFPYIKAVLNGSVLDQYSADVYSEHHDKIATKLSELKNIIIKYYPTKTTNELTSVLYDIFSCERDLASHNDIEDRLLVPAIKTHELNR